MTNRETGRAIVQDADITTFLRRLDATERNHTDLSASHTRQVEHVSDLTRRVLELEETSRDRRVEDARREEREKMIQRDISEVQADIKSIKGAFTKLLWIVGTAVIGAFVAFILAGGLKIG